MKLPNKRIHADPKHDAILTNTLTNQNVTSMSKLAQVDSLGSGDAGR